MVITCYIWNIIFLLDIIHKKDLQFSTEPVSFLNIHFYSGLVNDDMQENNIFSELYTEITKGF